ncbi:lysophospholipid acyltransferase family protein [Paracoccus pacificus]|uniref:Lysophospholipid acyltransferase family protein n=1 Tax=Paracoccus pacificus TaxID=1463598 RepID=A0ABW4RAS5_9RHOB
MSRIDAGRGEATWRGAPQPVNARPGLVGWLRALLRGAGIVLVLLAGVIGLLILRLIERPFHGPRRPWTGPWVQGVCRICLGIIGLGWRRIGTPMKGFGAAVANHSTWLDIFTLNAAMPIFFVSKSEVAGWPGINILTKVTNTHFVRRDPKFARAQAAEFAERTAAGHRLLFFPEGTSTDGRRILPFKATLFQGFLAPELPDGLAVQPVTVNYFAPEGEDPRFYGWWGDMDLGSHLLKVLSAGRQGHVSVTLHPPVPVKGLDRKELSRRCEAAVRQGFQAGG